MSNSSALALMRTARIAVIAKYMGQLLILLALLTIIPALVAFFAGSDSVAIRYVIIISFIFLIAIPMARLPEPKRIERNEALCISVLLFLIAPILMSYPLMADGLNWIDAWFEAVSGMTTTGLSTLPTIESHSRAFLFSRAWMQWYGGLGIAVLAVALIMGHRITSKRLMDTVGEEGQSTTARDFARQVLWVYIGLTLIGFALIWFTQPDPFIALIHSLAAVSTGGFSGFDASLAAMPLFSQFAITLMSLAGAISLPLYFQAVARRQPRLLLDTETRALLIAVALLTLFLTISFLHQGQMDFDTSFEQSLLLAVSAHSTTGFSNVDIRQLSTATLLLIIFAMLVGGSTGSTAGGLKLIRMLILLKLIQLTLQRINAPPRAVLPPKLDGEPLEPEDITNVLVFLGLWCGVLLFSWWIFLLYDEAPLQSLFDVVSAMGTVGLSSGITRPDLAPLLKIILCIDMLLGRLEIIAMLVLFYPRTWFIRRHETS